MALRAEVAEWQTLRSQTPLRATSCGFESHLRHQPQARAASAAVPLLPLRALQGSREAVSPGIGDAALDGAIAGVPRLPGWRQIEALEAGFLVSNPDIGLERWIAVSGDPVVDRRVGREGPGRHRPREERLVLVLTRAWHRMHVADLLRVRILQVETVAGAQFGCEQVAALGDLAGRGPTR